MLVPYIIYLIYLFIRKITESIICLQSQNVYVKIIAETILSKRLSMSKMKKRVLQVFKSRYNSYVYGNLQITNTMCLVHSIILIYNKSHNTRGL